MSHTKTVFVDTGASAASLAATAPDAPGKVAFLENDQLTASDDLTALSGSTANYQILSGGGNSIRFNGADVVKSSRAAQSDGTAQTITFTLGETTTYAREDNGTYNIKLIDVTEGREKFVIKTFETQEYATDQTGATIAAAFEVLIDAEGDRDNSPFKGISADDATDGTLVITLPVDQFARAAATDALPAPTENNYARSVGLPAQVDADIQAGFGFQGVTNQAGPNVVKPNIATAGLKFDRFSVFVKQTHGVREDIHEIIIYTNVANTTADTDLTAWV